MKAGEVDRALIESSLTSPDAKFYQWGLLTLITRYEFGRFLVVGAIAALGNLLSAWGYRRLSNGARFSFEASVVLGFSVGTVVSFLLNKTFTFQAHEGKTWRQALRFVLVSIVSITISTVVAHVVFLGCITLPPLAANKHHAEIMAHMLTIGVMAIFNYFTIKHVAFAKSGI